jgi:hypothetical protein
MKNARAIFALPFLLAFWGLTSCSDEEVRKMELTSKYRTVSLKEANIFLVEVHDFQNDNGDFTYHHYIVTDGVHDGGEGYGCLSCYDGATFYFTLKLARPAGQSFVTGNYELMGDWNWHLAEQGVRFGYFYLDSHDYWFDVPDNTTTQINVAGGFNPGENITLSLSGKLLYSDNTMEDEEDVDAKLYFKGKIGDLRPQ